MEDLKKFVHSMFFTKEGEIEDYNLVCPYCGAIYYEGRRGSEYIVKTELYMHGRVREGHEPCFVPRCPGCDVNGYRHFTSNDLKPRSKKGPGKVIKVKDGDIGPCYSNFTFVKVDWGLHEEKDAEKEKLIEGLSRFKNSYDGIWIYVDFPEKGTTIHFRMRKENVLETIDVFGRVSKEDAEIFVRDLLENVNKEVNK